MCGIAAILEARGAADSDAIRAMTAALVHRGPDGDGVALDGPVALGHRRLSILDLTPAGAQPMTSRCGRWTLAFNGEIYNHLDIRSRLSGPWRGHSDTETLVESLAACGFEATLQATTGMFAVAAWDRHEGRLWLGRDRMGEKPLYYGIVAGHLRAASELKSLLAGAVRPPIDRGSIALLLRHNCIPSPRTIWLGIAKLPPGHLLSVPADWGGTLPGSRPWWSVDALTGQAESTQSDEELISRLDALLRKAVAGQMVADVPLGAFLSGGIDSSAIVALMQAQSSRRVRTFTIGFSEADYDESAHAEAVAKHLGTDHTTMVVTPADALAAIPDLPGIWDEPFADSSQVPTLLLSRLTRQRVTVSLSGDGGDELFAGYNRHVLCRRLLRLQALVPRPIRLALASMITAVRPGAWDAMAAPLRRLKPESLRSAGDRAHKFAGVLASDSAAQLYRDLTSHWRDPAGVVLGATAQASLFDERPIPPMAGDLERIQYLDQLGYLPDDILVKVDRAAMSVGLETRVPFLDRDVVAFSWQMPERMRVRHGQGKWILRKLLERYVPRALIERPKMGFGIPLGDWLRGGLRDWAESLIDEQRLKREGYFDPAPIRAKWDEHLAGHRQWQYHLWDVLMFQAWLERWQ
jgi:asparagine synthase (glutamine-hydrolysing)